MMNKRFKHWTLICFVLVSIMFIYPVMEVKGAQIIAPFNWSCKFSNNSTNSMVCYSSSTIQVTDLKYAGGTTYCSAGHSLCFEYDTGLAWSWLSSTDGLTLPNPSIDDEETYEITYWDITSNYSKYPSYYYENNWEVQFSSSNKYVGIWDIEKDPGNNKTCPIVDGNVGLYDSEYNKCYYSMAVLETSNGSCPSVGGVTGRIQTFLTKQYCVYTLFGWEESQCNDSTLFGTTGKWLPNYQSCIVGSVDKDDEIDEYDGKFYCKDSSGNKTDPVHHDDGSYNNMEHHYYFCEKDQEIIGDYSTQCIMGYEFMDESKVISKFGQANAGHIALYCKTTIGADIQLPPNGEIPEPEPDLGDDLYGCEVIPKSIRDWIESTLNLVKYIALAIVIVLGILDFLKAAGSGEAEAMKKAGTDFLKRIIAVIILFLLPLVVNLILNLIEIYGADSTCIG